MSGLETVNRVVLIMVVGENVSLLGPDLLLSIHAVDKSDGISGRVVSGFLSHSSVICK